MTNVTPNMVKVLRAANTLAAPPSGRVAYLKASGLAPRTFDRALAKCKREGLLQAERRGRGGVLQLAPRAHQSWVSPVSPPTAGRGAPPFPPTGGSIRTTPPPTGEGGGPLSVSSGLPSAASRKSKPTTRSTPPKKPRQTAPKAPRKRKPRRPKGLPLPEASRSFAVAKADRFQLPAPGQDLTQAPRPEVGGKALRPFCYQPSTDPEAEAAAHAVLVEYTRAAESVPGVGYLRCPRRENFTNHKQYERCLSIWEFSVHRGISVQHLIKAAFRVCQPPAPLKYPRLEWFTPEKLRSWLWRYERYLDRQYREEESPTKQEARESELTGDQRILRDQVQTAHRMVLRAYSQGPAAVQAAILRAGERCPEYLVTRPQWVNELQPLWLASGSRNRAGVMAALARLSHKSWLRVQIASWVSDIEHIVGAGK